jgi:flavin reductase (DIM6/NTAB) family NADH-FMN oxidoreductase RutF
VVIGPQQFRDLMAGVCAPVTIVTTLEEGRPFGATVSAFASLSLNPPMVTVALDRGSSLLARILRVGRFGVNVLGDGQETLAVLFARRGTDRFAAVPWCADHGLPRLLETASWIACDLAKAVEGGDHVLLLGQVTWASRTEAAPLVYGHRVFGTHSGLVSRPIPTPAGGSARAPGTAHRRYRG